MFVSVIIAAGGRGLRLGGDLPKQLLNVAGRPVLERSVTTFLDHPQVDEIVVALPAEYAADPPPYLRAAPKSVRVVAGGARRQDSVTNAFEAVDARSELVVVHDAARPFASAELISRTIAAALESGAALAAMPARDTVKRASDRSEDDAVPASLGHRGHERRYVGETLPRDAIFLAQTPQAFRRSVLREALALGQAGVDATDEAALAERAGHPVRLVEGEATNIKITVPDDLPLAETLARAGAGAPARTGRAGTGYDLHRLVPGRRLMLGGVEIPSPVGALGHSDADVVCHAVTDAVLGALALGDIGRHFPDTDSRYANADSLGLLARATALVIEHGYEIGNVDVTVVLESPKIRDHVPAMRRALAGALGVDEARVSVKGKTNEGVDAIGRGEAVAAHAVALLRARG